jgi:hypothetical protein
MTTTTSPIELAEKVFHGCLSEDGPALKTLSEALPRHQQGDRTEHELDLMDFGLTVGLAFAIARGEDPYEPPESVRERAAAAANMAFERSGHWEITYREDREMRPVPEDYGEAVA